jgi:hypothetical protein
MSKAQRASAARPGRKVTAGTKAHPDLLAHLAAMASLVQLVATVLL